MLKRNVATTRICFAIALSLSLLMAPGVCSAVQASNERSSDATVAVSDDASTDSRDSDRVERTSTRVLALAAVLVVLLLAITRFKIHPFLALVVCSLMLGPVSSLAPLATVEAFLSGFADTMKWIGVVIVLGALIGDLLNQSGGTLRIAHTILGAVGAKRLPLAMGASGGAATASRRGSVTLDSAAVAGGRSSVVAARATDVSAAAGIRGRSAVMNTYESAAAERTPSTRSSAAFIPSP